MRWIYLLLLLALGVAGIVEPNVLFVVVVGIPLWVVLVPVALPPAERKVAKVAAEVRARRELRRVMRARIADPKDAAAGLSLSGDELAGALSSPEDDVTDDV